MLKLMRMLGLAEGLLRMAYPGELVVHYDLVCEAGNILAKITPTLRENNMIEQHPWYDPPRGSRAFANV